MTNRLFIGIDGGQSGSRAVVADVSGKVLAIGEGPACDHITSPQGYERNAAAIHGAIQDALNDAELNANDIVAVGMGLTSAPRELKAQPIFEKIVREICSPAHIWVDHDAATNLAGATAGGAGVMVIAGSGSIAYGINAAGDEGRAGGLGYLMGDEGSAWWIGINALQAAAAAADGRGPGTAILPFVLEHFNIPTIRHLHGILYNEKFQRTMVSGLTVDVAKMADTDGVARNIMTTAGDLLARMVVATIRQIHTEDDPVLVYPTGGVWRAGEVVLSPFRERLYRDWSTAEIHAPHFEPVFGALIRAYQQAGVEVSEPLLANLKAGVRG